MKTIDLAAVERIIAEVADTEIMPRFRKLAEGDVEMKGVDDPVTVADKAAEEALTRRLKEILPDGVVVGEESFAKDPAIISHFGGDKDVWVIDPIDGTRNFINGNPEFGVMIALVHQKKTVASWIHDPNTKDTLMAEEGGGVWLRGHKMHLAGHDAEIPKLGLIGTRFKKMLSQAELESLLNNLPKLFAGSAAAFDYGRLFMGGNITFANSAAARASYLLYRKSKPWDHLPGLFMVKEAGGYAAAPDGEPYNMEKGQKGLMVTPDEASWQRYSGGFNRALDSLIAD